MYLRSLPRRVGCTCPVGGAGWYLLMGRGVQLPRLRLLERDPTSTPNYVITFASRTPTPLLLGSACYPRKRRSGGSWSTVLYSRPLFPHGKLFSYRILKTETTGAKEEDDGPSTVSKRFTGDRCKGGGRPLQSRTHTGAPDPDGKTKCFSRWRGRDLRVRPRSFRLRHTRVDCLQFLLSH